ncbi:NAD(P)H-dependent oxidoreductase [Porticoccus sp. W117]|uniref:FMN-dependent NADH-azoreductase n=1 Tax=Porticoccus sp. W117 TaxID=3054777 RepID=UPI0025931D30|nr:NAD(P)H-dependent oxidoreductase [Porticoccus sp. W117]MDM3872556.1 NAD(P)H-dependent oxidoreductase [Porticoccus sp. W117]
MKRLLSLQSSLFGAEGASGKLSEGFIARLQKNHPGLKITHRDLNQDPVPHLNAETFSGFSLDANERNASQQQAAQLSDQLIEELKDSDTIVLGLPMYNFGIPSTLKAWMDHIARAGVTFRYGENGPEGLLTGKKLYVIATRGGQYAGTPADTQTEFVRNLFSFVGIRDIEFIYAEGLAMSDIREQSLSQAETLLNKKAAA